MKTNAAPKKTAPKKPDPSVAFAKFLMDYGIAYELFLICSKRAEKEAFLNPGYATDELFRLRYVEAVTRKVYELKDMNVADSVDTVKVAGIIINRYLEIAAHIGDN